MNELDFERRTDAMQKEIDDISGKINELNSDLATEIMSEYPNEDIIGTLKYRKKDLKEIKDEKVDYLLRMSTREVFSGVVDSIKEAHHNGENEKASELSDMLFSVFKTKGVEE